MPSFILERVTTPGPETNRDPVTDGSGAALGDAGVGGATGNPAASDGGAENVTANEMAKRRFLPASQTHEWRTIEGVFQRLGFACTLGLAALVATTILWTVSVPWVAWCLLRCVRPAVSPLHVCILRMW